MNNASVYKVNPKDYFDREYFSKEISNILENYWIFLCPEKILNKPNDYFVFNGFDKEIVIKKTSQGDISAFYNVCKHRGHKIYLDHFGNSEIRCPYHGWLYRDDLSVAKIPWNDKCYHLEQDSLSLDGFKNICIANGVIWGYFGEGDPDKAQYPGGKVSKALDVFHSTSESPAAVLVNTRGFNWKLIFENLYDRVHPIFLHANSLNKNVKINFDDHPKDFSFEGVVEYVSANIDNIGNQLDIDLGGVGADKGDYFRHGAYINGHIFPFLHFLTPNGGDIFCYESYIPISADEVKVYTFWLSSKNVEQSTRHNLITEYIKGAAKVLAEDWVAVESITSVVNKPDFYSYGAHEKNYFGIKKLGELG